MGEIAALAYSETYSMKTGFQIVTLRGRVMQKAAESADTAMAAVMKLDRKQVEQICESFPNVYPVNFNSPLQTVISGSKEELEQCKAKLSELPCRIIPLPVSAAFHSPYMNHASEEFASGLETFEIASPKIPVYANATGLPYGSDVKKVMTEQIKNPVEWTATIQNMIADGVTCFIEVGPGKTLYNLIKKISSDASVFHVEDEISLLETVKAVKHDA